MLECCSTRSPIVMSPWVLSHVSLFGVRSCRRFGRSIMSAFVLVLVCPHIVSCVSDLCAMSTILAASSRLDDDIARDVVSFGSGTMLVRPVPMFGHLCAVATRAMSDMISL